MLIATKLHYLLAMITLICAYKRVRILTKEVQSKVVGGKPAKIKEYPYMIRLEAKNAQYSILCGGSYIKPLWVLTAAHCLDTNDQFPKKPPSTGKKDRVKCIAGLEEKGQKRRYQRLQSVDLFINPTYIRNDTQMNNDIGLIELPEPFELNKVVQMIDIPMEPIDYSGVEVTLLGWGGTKATDKPGDVMTWPKTLQVLKTKAHEMQTCQTDMNSISAICVGEKGKVACSGDSGGPLVYNKLLIGVCSYGFGCSEEAVVYENTYVHLAWIINVTEYTPVKNKTNVCAQTSADADIDYVGDDDDDIGSSTIVSKTFVLLSFSILNLFLRLD